MTIKKIILTSGVIFLVAVYLYLGLTPSGPAYKSNSKYNIGLLVVATGRYVNFIPPLIASAHRFFMPWHNVTYFIFTDHPEVLPHDSQIVPVFQKRLGWPYDSMMRCKMFYENRNLFASMDYLYSCDADMIFVDYIGDELIADLVATRHPGYLHKRGLYENNNKSVAYVAPNEGQMYFAGGFYGGKKDNFVQIVLALTNSITQDLVRGITPRWHDESHLNRYFIDHKPSKILSPSYCYPEGWSLEYHPRLVALNKNHAALRA